jgi:hypothetical protein
MNYEAIAEAYLSKKLGNTPKFQSASDKELFSVEPPSPYKCRTCGTKVDSGPVAPRGAKQCRDCYQKDMFSKADNTVQYKRHVAEHPWKTVKKSIDFETVATRMIIKAKGEPIKTEELMWIRDRIVTPDERAKWKKLNSKKPR